MPRRKCPYGRKGCQKGHLCPQCKKDENRTSAIRRQETIDTSNGEYVGLEERIRLHSERIEQELKALETRRTEKR